MVAELKRLGEENRQLKMESDTLKKATAFFATHLAVKEGQFYVVQHRKVIDQMEALEDKILNISEGI